MGKLPTNNRDTPQNEDYCRSSQHELRGQEQRLLHNDLPALIGLRNRFARRMGYHSYLD